MIIAPDQQAIVLNPSIKPESVLPYIATAKVLHYQGHELVVVPHGLDETRVLRNMGVEAPSPIGFYYDWPKLKGLHAPFLHQRETAGFATLFKRCYILNDIGTGKTGSALWAIDYLQSLRELVGFAEGCGLRKVLVVSPLSTLERVWADAVFETFPGRSATVLHGTAERRRKRFAEDHDVYIVNHDGFEIICDVTRDKKKRITGSKLMRDDIDLILIDELAVYRNAQTDRYRVLKRAIEPRHWVWGMSGAPTPEAPTDAWAQCRLITPETVPEYFTQFRNMTMQQLGPYRWVARKEATEIVFKAMQPAIRFNRDDCIDLPPCMTVEREAPLSTEQKHHFDQIMKVLYTEVQGQGIKAVNEGVKMLKLLQACAGAMYAEGLEEKQTLVLDAEPRLKLLEEIVEECGQKVIVFAPFTGVIDVLEKRLAKRWSVGKVYGGTAAGERNRIFGAFQSEASPHVLVAHPAAMSHGLTLTEASTIVWYAPITSNDVYTQANGRITRPGQKHNQFIVHLSATPFERKLYKRLEEKTKVQGALLEMVEQGQIAA